MDRKAACLIATTAVLISTQAIAARAEILFAQGQWAAVRLLVAGRSTEDVAAELKTTRQTVNRWRHLPAFAVNTLLKKGLGQPGIDAHLETIFARGIDPDESVLDHNQEPTPLPADDKALDVAPRVRRTHLSLFVHPTARDAQNRAVAKLRGA